MVKTNAELTIVDLARPLSLDALEYFCRDELPKASYLDTARLGKFIRMGNVIVIGTVLPHGVRHGSAHLPRLLHKELVSYLQADENLLGLAQQTPDVEATLKPGIHDAGTSLIREGNDGAPVELLLGGDSYDFGRADEVGRQKTISVAQAIVGNTITVTQSQY